MGALTDLEQTGGNYRLDTPQGTFAYGSMADVATAMADYWSRLGQYGQTCIVTNSRGTRFDYGYGSVPRVRMSK